MTATDFVAIDQPEPKRTSSCLVLKVVLGLVAIALVAVGIYAAVMYGSIQRLDVIAENLERAAADLELAVEQKSATGIVIASESLQAGVTDLAEELDGEEWSLAARLPVYGEDVHTVRRLLDIAERLMAGTLAPVSGILVELQELPEGFEAIGAGVELFDRATVVLAEASAQVDEAAAALETLPSFHLTELNPLVDEFEALLAQVSQTLLELEPYLDAYDSAKGFLESLGL